MLAWPSDLERKVRDIRARIVHHCYFNSTGTEGRNLKLHLHARILRLRAGQARSALAKPSGDSRLRLPSTSLKKRKWTRTILCMWRVWCVLPPPLLPGHCVTRFSRGFKRNRTTRACGWFDHVCAYPPNKNGHLFPSTQLHHYGHAGGSAAASPDGFSTAQKRTPAVLGQPVFGWAGPGRQPDRWFRKVVVSLANRPHITTPCSVFKSTTSNGHC